MTDQETLELYAKHHDAPWCPQEVDNKYAIEIATCRVPVHAKATRVAILALRGALAEYAVRNMREVIACASDGKWYIDWKGPYESIDSALIAAYESLKEAK